jgi:hypothetical protein
MLVAADRKQAGRGIEFESTLFTAKPIGRTRHHDAAFLQESCRRPHAERGSTRSAAWAVGSSKVEPGAQTLRLARASIPAVLSPRARPEWNSLCSGGTHGLDRSPRIR